MAKLETIHELKRYAEEKRQKIDQKKKNWKRNCHKNDFLFSPKYYAVLRIQILIPSPSGPELIRFAI